MIPKQIILRIPNQPGQLALVSELIALNGIDIRAISINVDGDQGVMTVVLNDHEKGRQLLEGHGYEVQETPVIAAYAPDHPGGLTAIIKPLKDADVNVERLYLSAYRPDELPIMIIEVSDYAKGVAALKANYVKLIEGPLRF
jgi:hypothetical protein